MLNDEGDKGTATKQATMVVKMKTPWARIGAARASAFLSRNFLGVHPNLSPPNLSPPNLSPVSLSPPSLSPSHSVAAQSVAHYLIIIIALNTLL
jgi:hypothetical protein